jgi:hypothetical protein
MKRRILVFPSGSEIGLEIHRSVEYSNHFEMIGGSSIDDHGSFVYKTNINNIPFVDSPNLINQLNMIIGENQIDAIFPTMDSVIAKLSANREIIKCKVISPSYETCKICLSKKLTVQYFSDTVKVPHLFSTLEKVEKYPIFLKPDIGYSSRGTLLAKNKNVAEAHLLENPNCLIFEYLPGKEYTIDCFTNAKGEVLFFGARERLRISNGIAVRTETIWDQQDRFATIVNKVNQSLNMRGAWFIQLKEDIDGELTLLEIACRLGGSSSLYRMAGVNFALLTIFDYFGHDVKIINSRLNIVQDRALLSRYKVDVKFDTAYFDLDDCLIINNRLNLEMTKLIYQFITESKKVVLLSKHKFNIHETLKKHRIENLFDMVLHLNPTDCKSDYIESNKSIFIDDSYSERQEVYLKWGIPVFAPDAVTCLIH